MKKQYLCCIVGDEFDTMRFGEINTPKLNRKEPEIKPEDRLRAANRLMELKKQMGQNSGYVAIITEIELYPHVTDD